MNQPDAIVVVRDLGLSVGMKVLLVFLNMWFLVPVPGLIWWLVIREDKPCTAKDVARMSWLSVGLLLLFFLGMSVLVFLLG